MHLLVHFSTYVHIFTYQLLTSEAKTTIFVSYFLRKGKNTGLWRQHPPPSIGKKVILLSLLQLHWYLLYINSFKSIFLLRFFHFYYFRSLECVLYDQCM